MLKILRNHFFIAIRIVLLINIIAHTVIAVVKSDSQNLENIEFAFSAALTLALTFGPDIIEKRRKIDIPDILEILIAAFIFAGIFLSVRLKLYDNFFWWDDLLHTLSGVIIGFIGFLFVYMINYRYSMDISPLLIALFSFAFAVTLGVFWEILEFAGDVLMGTAHQKWNLPDTETMLGKPYQGSGLRDTMSDLILDCSGALVTSIITYFMYKKRKEETLETMKRMIKHPRSKNNG